MGLLLQLFVVTTLVAVLKAAPLDQNAESTTVGIRPLPAVVTKPKDSRDSNESSDEKRQTRDTTNEQDQQRPCAASSTADPPQQFDTRSARDVSEKRQPLPAPQQSERKPTDNVRKTREIGQLPQNGNPAPAPGPLESHPPPRALPAGQPPLSAQGQPPRPEPYGAAYNAPRSVLSSTPDRTVRDTNSTPKPQKSTLPANIPSKPPQTSGQSGRQVRDISTSTSTSTSTTTSTSIY